MLLWSTRIRGSGEEVINGTLMQFILTPYICFKKSLLLIKLVYCTYQNSYTCCLIPLHSFSVYIKRKVFFKDKYSWAYSSILFLDLILYPGTLSLSTQKNGFTNSSTFDEGDVFL